MPLPGPGEAETPQKSSWSLTLPETNMETPKGSCKDYSPFKGGAIWVSMLVWGSVSGVSLKGSLGLDIAIIRNSRTLYIYIYTG